MSEMKRMLELVVELSNGICTIAKFRGNLGISGGELYANFMQYMSLENFQKLMARIAESGRLTRSGHLYFFVK